VLPTAHDSEPQAYDTPTPVAPSALEWPPQGSSRCRTWTYSALALSIIIVFNDPAFGRPGLVSASVHALNLR